MSGTSVQRVDAEHELLEEVYRRTPSYLTSGIFHAVLLAILLLVPLPGEPDDQEILILQVVPPEDKKQRRNKPEPRRGESEAPSKLPAPPDPRAVPLPEPRLEPPPAPPMPVELPVMDPSRRLPSGLLPTIAPGPSGPRGRAWSPLDGRDGLRKDRLPPGRVRASPEVVHAVKRGLAWLARVQEADGHWEARKWGGAADPTNCGVTGLALLSFLGAGYTDRDGEYVGTVRRALRWLRSTQKANGHFGNSRFYEHAICTMAVAQAHAMSPRGTVGRMAQRAVNRIIRAQPPSGGLDYNGYNPRRVDVSVTGWNIMAIKSAVVAKLKVPPEAIRRSRRFLQNATYPDGRVGYSADNHKTRPGNPSPSMTAVGALCRLFLDCPRTDPLLVRSCDYLLQSGVQLNDLYYTYYATLAMFQMGARSKYWRAWNRGFRDPLIGLQAKGGPLAGSWHPQPHRFGRQGGRVYSTAMAILSLEAYWIYLPLYQQSGHQG